MAVACILIEHFACLMERERAPHLTGRKLILVSAATGKPTVFDASPEVTGILPGAPVAEALSRHPLALQLQADPAHYQQGFDRLLDDLERVSPGVEPATLGGAFVDLTGLLVLYGSRATLFGALQEASRPYAPQIGVAPNKFAAAVAAQGAAPGTVVLTPPDLAAFLAPCNLAALPVPDSVRARMGRLGLRTLGDVARQGIGPLQAHFGRAGRLAWELAHGIDQRPLLPRRHQEAYSAALTFPAPTVARETMLLGIERLLLRLFNLRELRGRYARVAELRAAVANHPVWQRKLVFKEAAGSAVLALPAFKRLLNLHPPPGPLEDLSLSLSGITGDAGRQLNLFADVRRSEQLRDAVHQLETRLGHAPLYQYRDAEPWSRIPERRRVLVEFSR